MEENEQLAEEQVPEQEKPVAEAPIQETSQEQEEEFQVPRKLLGKSNEEIIREYRELERRLGKQGQELGELRKKVTSEESTPVISRPVVDTTQTQQTPQYDLDKVYDELWEKNPKDAPKLYAQLIRERDRQKELLEQTTQIAQAAAAGQLQGYEDFNELRPTMVAVANELLPYVNPSEVNHPKVFQALYLVAKALVLPNKMKQLETAAIEKAKKKVTEKQAAFSEDPTALAGEDNVPFSAEHMSLDQMNKVLGISE